jgi:hypothetical protein
MAPDVLNESFMAPDVLNGSFMAPAADLAEARCAVPVRIRP